MTFLQSRLRWGFEVVEAWLDRIFGPAWNPLYQLGALGFFYYWVVAVSGIYVYILFDTGTTEAYESVEYMTVEQWYLGGVMRSLHRYASDGMVLMMVVHMLREFALDRYRGARWFTWVTGTPVLWLVFVAGISGYWMVWDELAQYIAILSTEWLDWLGIFGEPIARNFLAPHTLDDRFFTPADLHSHRCAALVAVGLVDPSATGDQAPNQSQARPGGGHFPDVGGAVLRQARGQPSPGRFDQGARGARSRLVLPAGLSLDGSLFLWRGLGFCSGPVIHAVRSALVATAAPRGRGRG